MTPTMTTMTIAEQFALADSHLKIALERQAQRIAALVEAGNNLSGLIEEAESVHIYDFDNGDEQDDDCAYLQGRKAWDDAVAALGLADTLEQAQAPAQLRDVPRAEPNFEKAKLSGYNVELDEDAGGWWAFTPDGDEIPLPKAQQLPGPVLLHFPTEREAWEACDGHRMFGANR